MFTVKVVDPLAIRCGDFHPSGQLFAVGTNSKAVHLCRYKTEEEEAVISTYSRHHRGSVYCLW